MNILQRIGADLRERFNLLPDKDNEATIIESIRENVEIKGVRVWILICAIFTASLGLNVNSTAVVIGAMLISPLMDPIVGLGLGLGIYDLDLVRKSLRSLLAMTLISVITATLYFTLSPLSLLQSELLARTQPTIYDVLIAFVGGIAGILANASRFKGNILMGVAIATALMPPLCTAGYGLSQGNMSYFFGASYLFTINATFIALSTLIVVRLMHFSPVRFVSTERERHIRHLMIAITLGVAIPSVYSGFLLVRESISEDAANRFVRDHLNTGDRQALDHTLSHRDSLFVLEVPLIGRYVDSLQHDSLQRVMQSYYGLGEARLVLRQSFASRQDSADLELGKRFISRDLYQRQEALLAHQEHERDSLMHELQQLHHQEEELRQIEREFVALVPELTSPRLVGSEVEGRRVVLVLYAEGAAPEGAEAERIASWLSARLGEVSLRYVKL
ncbi:MAG: TIGR00341 family protein [Porphyromonas sp.]|nr:TIGR00341 family protein [Porphyromonas sp.]